MRLQKGLIGFLAVVFLAIAAVIILNLFFNSIESLPGDSLYPVKRLGENLKLSINELSFLSRANVYLDMAAERLNELSQLVKKQNKGQEMIETLSRLQEEEDKALANLEREKARGTNLAESVNRFESLLLKQQTVLQNLSFDVLRDVQKAVQRAYLHTDDILQGVHNLYGR